MTSETGKPPIQEQPKINLPIVRLEMARAARLKEKDEKSRWKVPHAIATAHGENAAKLKIQGDESGAKAEFLLAAQADEKAYNLLTEAQPASLHSQFSLSETTTGFYIKGGSYEKADEFISGVLSRMTPGTDHFQVATGLKSLARRHLAAQNS